MFWTIPSTRMALHKYLTRKGKQHQGQIKQLGLSDNKMHWFCFAFPHPFFFLLVNAVRSSLCCDFPVSTATTKSQFEKRQSKAKKYTEAQVPVKTNERHELNPCCVFIPSSMCNPQNQLNLLQRGRLLGPKSVIRK